MSYSANSLVPAVRPTGSLRRSGRDRPQDGLMADQAGLARSDPSAFIELCCAAPNGRPVRQAAVHRDLQDFLSAHRKALVELPRDHGKSTQVCGRVVCELGRDPGLRVKLVCATDRLAADRSRYLRDLIAGYPRVRSAFPQLTPSGRWAVDAFTVVRPAEVLGPSVAAFGVGAASTGTRADLLVCDDVVDVAAAYSRADRDRVRNFFFDNLLNLLEPDGRCWCLFTPWHADDLNAHLKRNPAFAHFRRAVGPTLRPVWPEKWPSVKLAGRRAEIGAAAFARGYHLTPIAVDETAVKSAWVQFWTDKEPSEFVVLSVDPAVSAGPTADASALVVLGRAGTVIHCREATARRVAAPDLVRLIDACDRHWAPDVILFEANAAFEAVRALLAHHARFGPKVEGVTQSRAKAARVAAFAVAVENGSFRLKGDRTGGVDPSQRELFDEMTTFPFGEHDDLLDAAATGTAYLLAGAAEPRVWV